MSNPSPQCALKRTSANALRRLGPGNLGQRMRFELRETERRHGPPRFGGQDRPRLGVGDPVIMRGAQVQRGASKHGTFHMNDVPAQIGIDGTPDVFAAPTISAYQ